MLRTNLNRLLVTAFSLCVFISCTNTPKAQLSIKGGSIPIAKDLATDSVLVNMYTPYKIGLDNIMEEILCYSPFFLEKGRPESELSNWMADVCYQKVTETHKADFCLLNYGGIRASLPKGAIKRKDIYQLMPFENELVVVELADTDFYRVLDYLIPRIMKEGRGGLSLNMLFKKGLKKGSKKITQQSLRVAISKAVKNGYITKRGEYLFLNTGNQKASQWRVGDRMIEKNRMTVKKKKKKKKGGGKITRKKRRNKKKTRRKRKYIKKTKKRKRRRKKRTRRK